MMHQQMMTGGEMGGNFPRSKEETPNMGNNGDEGEEMMKMWEENGIVEKWK